MGLLKCSLSTKHYIVILYEAIMTKERAQYINSVNTRSLCNITIYTTDANRLEKKDACLLQKPTL